MQVDSAIVDFDRRWRSIPRKLGRDGPSSAWCSGSKGSATMRLA